MTGAERDRGRVSIFLAIALFAVLVMIGLSFDAAGRLRTQQRADNLAAEAARAGGQQIDVAQAMSAGLKVVDMAAAADAAVDYLDRAGVEGDATWVTQGEGCADTARCLRVDVQMTYDMVMLPIFGFPQQVTVNGSATAELLTDEDI
ncbi:pilus assembly protein TadG-related protein [Catenuloplanes atrovinosus]|uniref:Flp pilus assembly protein TadG n=1 Tax=Catenuloplanes atrovinosus TaxID=137266 RepID=A0AAE3YRX0_9ACTN|nr:pilus assembly protein TadG-related protein [Catenuloplanes atrovinosus]MDR7278858.1 Flp pilus assembly protein TadG [Catenuloplanes atrovinosus]